MPGNTLVLPVHMHTRVAQLRTYHAACLEEVRAAGAEPGSAVDIVPLTFKWQRDARQPGFAIGDALAYPHYLATTVT
jgi:hypothetical protein